MERHGGRSDTSRAPRRGFSTSAAVRDLERRWGLTLVSFVPSGSADRLVRLQQLVQKLLDRHLAAAQTEPVSEPVVEFYGIEQLHCTHLTLTRSSAWGPVRVADFVKPGIDPQRLCDTLAHATAGLGAITVSLDRLGLSENGFQLTGGCADDDSTDRRYRLLDQLNTQLPRYVNLSRRAWDTDRTRHGSVHLRLGFMKRPCADYDSLVAEVARLRVDPITLRFDDVTLVHHRYRSLRAPHAGSLRFPLTGQASRDQAREDQVAPPFGRLDLLW